MRGGHAVCRSKIINEKVKAAESDTPLFILKNRPWLIARGDFAMT